MESVPLADVDALHRLWLVLHHHHQAVAPQLAPFVPDDPSWEVIRSLLARSAADGLLLRVGSSSEPLGFACVVVTRNDPLWADTWQTGADIAEIRLLVVADEARDRGLGSALLDAVDAELTAVGVRDQVVGAIEPNDAAIRLYERRGFRPAWLQLTRFEARRPRPDSDQPVSARSASSTSSQPAKVASRSSAQRNERDR